MLLNKPAWWDDLAARYGFANDLSVTIDSEDMLDTLYAHVRDAASLILSPEFLAGQSHILKASSSEQNQSNIIASLTNADDLMIGYGGSDFLSGRAGDDILHGGGGNDYFSPGAGNDLVIGGDETGTDTESDTVGYLTATSGIVVEAGAILPEEEEGTGDIVLAPGQDYYAYTYQDWVDPSVPKVYGFETGPGGDLIDVSALLASVGYTGSDPVADKYIRFGTVTGGIKIQFDPDGSSGGASPKELVRLYGITIADFSVADNLITTPVTVVTPHWKTDDFALVSNDGQGGHDVLYSIENILGSDYDDIIHGTERAGNVLLGGIGNDSLYGGGGNDILSGGPGADMLSGEAGDDTILLGLGGDTASGGAGADIFRFEGIFADDTVHITDFQTGAGGDKLDLSAVLTATGTDWSDAVANGVLSLVVQADGLHVLYDADGTAGEGVAQSLAILDGVTDGQFSVADNLATDAPEILLVSVLGQSNAAGLRVFGDDTESGLTRLHDGLAAATDYAQIVQLPMDEFGDVVSVAVGGSRVDGDTVYAQDAVWWYPDEGQPGEILIRAVEILGVQIAQQRAQGIVNPLIVWGQGESDAVLVGMWGTEAERDQAQQRYMDATASVFDYIKARLGDDIQFYIMETGGYSVGGAQLLGTSQTEINNVLTGLPYIREAQENLALTRDDVHLAANYTDLPMNYDVTGAADEWHYFPEQREIIGDRIADFIALDLGYDFVLDDPGNYPLRLLDDLDLQDSPGEVRTGNEKNNIVVGTLGNDILGGGAGGNDALYGGEGDDTYLLTSGIDTVIDHGGYDIIALNFSMAGFGGMLTTLAQGEDLRLVIDGGARDMILFGQLSGDSARFIEALQFTDGTISLTGAEHWLFAPIGGGAVYGDSLSEVIWGSAGDDNLRGYGGDDVLYGGAGIDELWGGDGNDIIHGGDGDDIKLRGDEGNDVLYGDDGDDDVRGGDGDDLLYGGSGADRIEGDDGNDLLYGEDGNDALRGRTGNDVLYGGAGDDDLRGQEGDDIIHGGDGNDTLHGGNDSTDTSAGNDVLYGDAGDDRFYAAGGDDILYGGAGADRMTGGTGADTFVFEAGVAFEGVDRIYDFSIAEGDHLDVSGLLDLYDPLTMAISDFVQITTSGTKSILKVDIDGTGAEHGLTQIATLDNVTGLEDEAALVASGRLVV